MWKHKWSSRNFLRQIKNSPWSRSKDRIITPLIVLQFRILLDPNPDKKFDSGSGFRATIITPLFWMWKTFSWSNWIHRLRFMLCGKGRRILGDDTIEIFPGYRTSWSYIFLEVHNALKLVWSWPNRIISRSSVPFELYWYFFDIIFTTNEHSIFSSFFVSFDTLLT